LRDDDPAKPFPVFVEAVITGRNRRVEVTSARCREQRSGEPVEAVGQRRLEVGGE
jgi:hypothetical protein